MSSQVINLVFRALDPIICKSQKIAKTHSKFKRLYKHLPKTYCHNIFPAIY